MRQKEERCVHDSLRISALRDFARSLIPRRTLFCTICLRYSAWKPLKASGPVFGLYAFWSIQIKGRTSSGFRARPAAGRFSWYASACPHYHEERKGVTVLSNDDLYSLCLSTINGFLCYLIRETHVERSSTRSPTLWLLVRCRRIDEYDLFEANHQNGCRSPVRSLWKRFLWRSIKMDRNRMRYIRLNKVGMGK